MDRTPVQVLQNLQMTHGTKAATFNIMRRTILLSVQSWLFCLLSLFVQHASVSAAAITFNVSSLIKSGKFLTLVNSTNVTFSGSYSTNDIQTLQIDADDAQFEVASENWSKSETLQPGLNKLWITALDSTGRVAQSSNVLIVAQQNFATASGTLSPQATWSGIVHVTANVSVPAGGRLMIQPGTVVLFASGTGLNASSGTIEANGTLDEPILFAPLDGSSEWGPLAVSANGHLTVSHFEMVAGRISSSGNVDISDGNMHHTYSSGSMLSAKSGTFSLHRMHLHHYHDSNINSSRVLAEDCLIEDCDSTDGDPFEMSGALSGTLIQRNTLRRSSGKNADAFDLNSGTGVTYRNNLVHDVSDKGFSVGTAGGAPSTGIILSNNIVWNATTGIAVKDGSLATIVNNTIANCSYGIQAYPKYSQEGGHVVTGYNNILWNNGATIVITNGSMQMEFSDLAGGANIGVNQTNFVTGNNLSTDPLFIDAARFDFQLSSNSPAIGTGKEGGTMGVAFPVGGLPDAPAALSARSVGNQIRLEWNDTSDNENAVVIERSTNKIEWTQIALLGSNSTYATDEDAVPNQNYYYRAKSRNGSGESDYSNPAAAMAQGLQLELTTQTELGQVTLKFQAHSGQSYSILYRDSFAPGSAWSNLKDIPASATNSEVTFSDTIGAKLRFYEITSPAQP